MLTTFDLDEYVIDAFRAGASGFLLKSAPPTSSSQPCAHSTRVRRYSCPRARDA
jgi:DNA-binding NarL/FixJ family response regulator